jgi:hypothetical protein
MKFHYSGVAPSVRVDKSLLIALEKFIADFVAQALQVPADNARPSLTIKVEDKFGVETFASMDRFRPARFPRGTEVAGRIWTVG